MGSKVWGFAALIAGIALTVVTGPLGAGIASWIAPALWGATLGFGTIASVVGAREARKAANAGLQDRITTIRSTDEPRAILYGRGRTGGVLLYASPPYGVNREKQFLQIGLVGHACDAVEDVWLNDERVQLDPEGYVIGSASGKWRSRIVDHRAVPGVMPAFGGVIPEPDGGVVTAVLSVAYVQAAGDVATVAVPGVDYALEPNSFAIRNLLIQPGVEFTVTYAGRFALDGYIRVLKFNGYETGDARKADADIAAAIAAVAPGEFVRDTATHDGVCRLDVEMSYEPTIFADGVPNFSATVRGMRVYDPRKDSTNGGTGAHRYADPATWEWSRLAALCTGHYVMTDWGFAVAPTRMDWPSVASSADRCAIQIQIHPTDAGFTDYQFTVDGFLSTQANLGDNLDELALAMNGFVTPVGAKWRIVAGGWTAPAADAVLEDRHVVADGDAELFGFAQASELFNCVRGRYRDEATFEITDMPPYVSDDGMGGGYVPQDGAQFWRDVDLPLTINAFRAQRLARQILHRHRAAVGYSATFSLAAWRYQVGDRLRLRLTPYGWDAIVQDGGTGKPFMVVDRAWVPPHLVRLALVEDGSALYSASHSEFTAPDPTPNTTLPSASFVARPSNFEGSADATDFYLTPGGERVGFLRLTWDAVTDASVLGGGWIEIEWKRVDEEHPRTIRVSPFASEYRLEGLHVDEVLNIGIRFVNSSGAKSDLVGIEGNIPELNLVNGVFSVGNAFLTAAGGTVWSGNHAPNSDWKYGTSGWTLFRFATPSYVLQAVQSTMPSVQRVIGPPAWNVMVEEQGVGAVAATAIVAGWTLAQPATCVPGERWGCKFLLELDGCDAVVGIAFYRADGSFIPGAVTYSPILQKGYVNAGSRAAYIAREVFGTVPAGAAGVRPIAYKYGTKSPATSSRMWVLEADLRELVGTDAMPPFAVGAPGPQSQTWVMPYNATGATMDLSTLQFISVALGQITAPAAGIVAISVTSEVSGSATGGSSTITLDITQSGKRQLDPREVMTLASGASSRWSGTLAASWRVQPGESIAPVLRLSRTRFGLGVGNTTDKVARIDATYTLTPD